MSIERESEWERKKIRSIFSQDDFALFERFSAIFFTIHLIRNHSRSQFTHISGTLRRVSQFFCWFFTEPNRSTHHPLVKFSPYMLRVTYSTPFFFFYFWHLLLFAQIWTISLPLFSLKCHMCGVFVSPRTHRMCTRLVHSVYFVRFSYIVWVCACIDEHMYTLVDTCAHTTSNYIVKSYSMTARCVHGRRAYEHARTHTYSHTLPRISFAPSTSCCFCFLAMILIRA